ncbi:MAG: hypothetical protein IJD59_07235, partial [Clostridia bacterium]|nr:hypothetical protein [Clostridia bacterium]
FPLCKREIFCKKSRLFTAQKHSFCYKIFEYEKSYLFLIRIIVKKVNAVALRQNSRNIDKISVM